MGLGAGVGGVGMLLDCAGDDTYVADTPAQAAAVCGLGYLADLSGRDRYRGVSC